VVLNKFLFVKRYEMKEINPVRQVLIDFIKNKIWIVLGYLILGITFIGLMIFTLDSYRPRFHSDAATAGMLAIEQVRTGNLLVNGWAYSQDFWPMFVFNSVYFLNGLVESVFLRTQIWVGLQNITLIILTWILLKKLNKSHNKIFFLAYLFSGLSVLWSEFYFGQGQYGNVLLFILASTVIITSMIESNKKFGLNWVLLAAVLTYANSTSIRYVPLFYVPAAASLIFLLVKRPEYRKSAISILLNLAISFVVGLMIFSWLKGNLIFLDGVNNSGLISYASMLQNNVPRVLDGMFSLLSDEMVGHRLVSATGIIFFIKLILGLTLVGLGLTVIKKSINGDSSLKPVQIFMAVFTLVLLTVSLLSVLFMSTSINRIATARYLMIAVFFLIVLSSISDMFKSIRMRFVIVFVMALVAISNVWELYLKPVGKPHHFDAIIQKLEDEGLTYGFATYWNADVVTVLSDYKVKIFHVHDGSLLPWHFMSTKSFYQNPDNDKSFVLLSEEEDARLQKPFFPEAGEPQKVISMDGYKVYVFNADFSKKVTGWLQEFNNSK
jgi:hypothetical protein